MRLALAAVSGACSATVSAADYTVLMSGQPTGSMAVAGDQRARSISFQFADRGRGPALQSVFSVDSAGLPERLSTKGVNYYKLPVQEEFERSGGAFRWKAPNDAGSSREPGFYLPDEQTPEHLAALARALKASGGKLPLLPAGQAQISHLLDRELTLDGKPIRASLFLLTGLEFAPIPLWLDEHGELLFQGGDWFATVRSGLEQEAGSLVRAQQQALVDAAKARAGKLLRRPETPIVFTDVAIFDAGARSIRRDMMVVVEGNRIRSVTPTKGAKVPGRATVIDGRGRTMLPGFWDMHVHLSNDVQGLMHLAAGVTSVRDLANNADELARRRQLYNSGELPGPRVIASGFIDGPGPLAGPIKVLAGTPEEMRAAVQSYARRGYKGIKLYSSVDPKLVPVAVAEARRLGMRVSGHVPAGMTMKEAVAAGFDEIHHINFMALNFMGDEVNAKSNGIARITAMAERGWQIDPASPEVQALIAYLKRQGTVIDPTVSLFEDDLLGKPGKPFPNIAPVFDRLPPVVQRSSRGGALAKTAAEAERNARSYNAMLGLVKALHDGGVTIVAGTDERLGFTFHRELEAYEQAGIARTDILYIATLGAAKVAGLDEELGSIEEGKLADLILVDGNPAARMSDVRNTVLVMKDGVPFCPADLHKEVGVAPEPNAASCDLAHKAN